MKKWCVRLISSWHAPSILYIGEHLAPQKQVGLPVAAFVRSHKNMLLVPALAYRNGRINVCTLHDSNIMTVIELFAQHSTDACCSDNRLQATYTCLRGAQLKQRIDRSSLAPESVFGASPSPRVRLPPSLCIDGKKRICRTSIL